MLLTSSDDTPAPVDLREWIGRSERVSDLVGGTPARLLAATLDREEAEPLPGAALPPLAHWLHFLAGAPQQALGPDGHPQRGGFLPPVPLPRRMWAAGRLSFAQPLCVGDELLRRSRIVDVRDKAGRSGRLVFVTVRHEVDGPRGLVLSEEQDIVYREAAPAGTPAVPAGGEPAPTDAQFGRTVTPDPVLLMRYSALTFNGHRIHYDRPYATGVEGYPGLVVHGPLIATLLLDALARAHPQRGVRRFAFRALRPLFDTRPFQVSGCLSDDGRSARLWATDPDGWLAMDASVELD